MSYLLLAPGKQRKRPESPFHVWIIGKDERWLEFYRLGTGFLLRFPGLADFTMTNAGTDITCRPVTGVSAATIEHLYLNQILPLAQNAAGALSFHGSAVVIEDFAIAFLGPSGRGKSTLAASFAVKGQAFLTDDGLITEERNGTYHILPSHPSIRLWDDSQEELLAPNSAPILPVSYTRKSRFLASAGLAYCDESMPFRAAYFLGEGNVDDVVIQPLSASELLVQFLSNSFQLDIESPAALSRGFDGTAELCRHVQGFHLDYPRDYDDLDRIREAIAQHATSLAQADPQSPSAPEARQH